MAFTRNWSEGTPLGTEDRSLADDYIRYTKVDVADRLKNMIYGFVSGENTLSQHFQYVQFYEQSSVSQPSAGYGRLYTKAVGGKCELYWQDEDGDEIQLTNGGNFGGGNLELIADKDLIGSSTSDITINTNKFTVAGATGNTVIAGTLGVTGLSTLTGGLTSPAAITSTLATGTAPFTVASTTKVTNLNADQVDGYDVSAYSGGQSYTFPGGLIIKMGEESVAADTTDEITYGAAFSNGVISYGVSYKSTSNAAMDPCKVTPKSGSETSILQVTNGHTTTMTLAWFAIGY